MPACIPRGGNPLGTELCDAAVDKWPDLPARTLARMMIRDHPGVWDNIEAARKAVQYRRGKIGVKHREIRKKRGLCESKAPSIQWNPDAFLPPSQEKAYIPFNITVEKETSALVMGDLHIPYHNIKAITAALRAGQKKNSGIIILNGDIFDFYRLSRFDKDPTHFDAKKEVEMVNQMLDAIDDLFPKARKIWKDGNHDERFNHYSMVRAPEIYSLVKEYCSIEKLLDFEGRRNWEYVTDRRIINLGKLPIIHGHEYPTPLIGPVNAARGLFNRTKDSAIVNHHHQTSQNAETKIGGDLVMTWSIGCLCYDDKTELLTDRGFVYFKDLKSVDKVANFDIKNGGITLNKPKAYQRYHYSGKMILLESRRINLMVTPEHKMVYKRSDDKWRVKSADFVSKMDRPKIPTSGIFVSDVSVSADDAELIAWIVTEGTLDVSSDTCKRYSIYQKKNKGVLLIRSLLIRMGFKFHEYTDKRHGVIRFRICAEHSRLIHKIMDFNHRRLPRALLNSNSDILRIAYETLILGDGHRKKNGITDYFATISHDLAIDFQELVCKCGMSCVINKEIYNTKFKRNALIYRCLVRKFSVSDIKKSSIKYYNGPVFDITTDTGFFVVRRDGKVCVSGNCELHPFYARLNRWNHGFADVQVLPNGNYHVRNKHVIDGVVMN